MRTPSTIGSRIPTLPLPSEYSYSTRTCRRCSVAMEPAHDRRGRRAWRCETCGRTER